MKSTKHTTGQGERLQKILARGGVASRRHAEELIAAGRVRVNGKVVTEPGTRADPRSDRVEVDGKRVVAEVTVYVVLNKARGVVTTAHDPQGRPTVGESLRSAGGRVYPVGRLDFATSGVLLATNDGDFANGLLHPRKAVPKTYVVKVGGHMAEEDVEHWRRGVMLEDGKTLPAEVTLIRFEKGEASGDRESSRDKTWLELTIREGRNQQIRRMGEATGFPVMRLSRTSFAGVTAEGLKPGAWRYLTRQELVELKKVYGVPASVPAAPAAQEVPRGRKRPPPASRGEGPRGRAPRGEGPRGRAPHAEGPRGRAPHAEGPRGKAPRAAGPREGSDRHEGWRRRREGGGEETSPRYGMGAPGRRGYGVRDDYGGGSGRGSSGPRDAERDAPRGPQGRQQPSRTTGTGGGIGAGEGSHRMHGRRGRGGGHGK